MTRNQAGAVRIDVHQDRDEDLLSLVRRGLLRDPPRISSRFFYDERGSDLFERICEQPEYYQTCAEEAILHAIGEEVAQITGAEEVVELGSGAAVKTRKLLSALRRGRSGGTFPST